MERKTAFVVHLHCNMKIIVVLQMCQTEKCILNNLNEHFKLWKVFLFGHLVIRNLHFNSEASSTSHHVFLMENLHESTFHIWIKDDISCPCALRHTFPSSRWVWLRINKPYKSRWLVKLAGIFRLPAWPEYLTMFRALNVKQSYLSLMQILKQVFWNSNCFWGHMWIFSF